MIANGKSIGKNEWLVELDLAPQLRKQYDDPTLPTLAYQAFKQAVERCSRTGSLNDERRVFWIRAPVGR